MKRSRILPLSLALILLVSSATAQSADWQAVKNIPPGTKIKLTLKHGRTFGHCEFEGATDDALDCYLPHLGLRSYPRENVRAVSLVHNGVKIGLAVGAGLGAVSGAVKPQPGLGRGGSALVSGVLLGVVGTAFGAVLNPFFHGKTIYRSP
ncbi:MAG: hypothetical protein LAO24_24135 [Acidobacteriia bacterium]|nr:hypothetical protein [Terriglobia bacterium]